MPQPQRIHPAMYTTAILAAVLGLIVVSRQNQPASAARRAVPNLAGNWRPSSAEPRPLEIPPGRLPLASLGARDAVPAGFPAESQEPEEVARDEIGPIADAGTPVYAPARPAGIQRLPSIAEEAAVVEAEGTPDQREDVHSAARLPLAGLTARAAAPNENALRPVLQQAAQLNRQAESLARRGAYYLARNSATQSLRMIAEALDLQASSGEHTAALTSALVALREADDFLPRGGEDSAADVQLVVAAHHSPVLRQQPLAGMTTVAALQRYYDFAQRQLVFAAGQQPTASHAMFLLGKLQPRLASHNGTEQTQLARAMVFHQAALNVDDRNYLAANELGVILAKFGQLQEARRILLHSVTTCPHADGWHNLAVVHQRLGEAELADYARAQAEQVAGGATGPRPKIEWVTPEAFAAGASSGKATPPAPSTSAKNADRSADNRSQRKETWLSPFGLKR